MVNPRDARAVDGLARRGRRDPGRPVLDHAARSRTRSPCAATSGPPRRGTTGVYDDEVVAGRRRRPDTRRGHPAPTPSLEALARLKPVVPPGRHGHRRQLLAAQRRRRRAAARRRRRACRRGRSPRRWPGSCPARWPASSRSVFGIGPVEAARTRSGAGRHRLGRPARRRAQRGVRRAVAGLPAPSGPTSTRRSSTSTAARSRSATRSAASGARIVGALAHELHRRGGGYGLAAICIGVGQGLAVVLRGLSRAAESP